MRDEWSRWCRCGDRIHAGKCPVPFCDCADGVPMKGWRYADEDEVQKRTESHAQKVDPED